MAGSGIKLEPGHVLDGRYALEAVIGEGGMGTVFSARHLELGETVAVKVLQPQGSGGGPTEEHIERFLREARLASKIKNEHVVKVLDVARGSDGRTPPYIVMELLDGGDIAELVRAFGKVPIPDACAYILQACEALAEAHSLGIVHRDLKSSNLHISHRPDGSPLVKVLDFGISKMHDEDDEVKLTKTSAVFGSPAYMSPEQIRSAKHVDFRTDVWAMAVVLYEMLTADLPFLGDNASAMLAAISADRHIPIAHFLPSVPPGLEAAVENALKKRRDDRTPSIAALAESIAPYALASAQASLVTIRHHAQRPQWAEQSSKRSAPSMQPPPEAIGATVRADPPVFAQPQPYGTGPTPMPMMETPRHAALSRTDRELRETQRMSPILLAVVVGIVVAAVFAIGFALFILRARPLAPTTVVVAAPPVAPSAAPLPPPIELPSSEPVPVPATSSTTASRPGPSVHPHQHPHSTPSTTAAKTPSAIDTSQRE